MLLLALCTINSSCSKDDDNELEKPNGIELKNGHGCVDLGLSVKWATYNVGATKPEEYGNYYAWGEIEPKQEYDLFTYEGSLNDVFGTANDVAHVKWGGKWRIPTISEIYELRDKCSNKETTLNGVKGILFTAKNGNSIFLPAAGRYEGNKLVDAGITGHYWQGSSNNGDQKGEVPYYDLNSVYHGLTIRPVYAE